MSALETKIEFIEKREDSLIKGFFNKKRENNNSKFNEIKVTICQFGTSQPLAIGEGLWTRYLAFGSTIYWKTGCPVPQMLPLVTSSFLPSSSLKRQEIDLIKVKNYNEADK